MRPLEVKKSKGMKLSNVIIKQIEDNSDLERELKDLNIMANVLGFHLKGPQVIKKYPLVENGGLIEKTEFIIQCDGTVPPDIPDEIHHLPEIHSGEGLFVHFTGRIDSLSIVGSKISVYAYENEIQLTGETYNVFLDQESPIITVDVHCPIVNISE